MSEPDRETFPERDLAPAVNEAPLDRSTDRAEPGDVLGIEHGGETTRLGDTAQDEVKRLRREEERLGDADEDERQGDSRGWHRSSSGQSGDCPSSAAPNRRIVPAALPGVGCPAYPNGSNRAVKCLSTVGAVVMR
jgi:hypothetical protein